MKILNFGKKFRHTFVQILCRPSIKLKKLALMPTEIYGKTLMEMEDTATLAISILPTIYKKRLAIENKLL